MNWYFPHIPLILLAVLIWANRDALRRGRLDYLGKTVRRASQPVTFWAFVVTQLFWIVAMVAVLVLWAADVGGLRSG